MNEIIYDSKKASHYEDLARKAVFGYDQLFTMALSILCDNIVTGKQIGRAHV